MYTYIFLSMNGVVVCVCVCVYVHNACGVRILCKDACLCVCMVRVRALSRIYTFLHSSACPNSCMCSHGCRDMYVVCFGIC